MIVHISSLESAGLPNLTDNQKDGRELQAESDRRYSASDLRLL